MGRLTRTASIIFFATALSLGPVGALSSAHASPSQAAGGGYSLAPPPRIPFPPTHPRFPILDGIQMPYAFPELALSSRTQTISTLGLFGEAAVTRQENAVAKAACRAMNLAFQGTGQHGYWDNAIRANVDKREFDADPFARVGINFAIDRAASAISAAQYGGELFKFYVDTCYQRKLG